MALQSRSSHSLLSLVFAPMDDLLDLTWGSSSTSTASSANTQAASAASKQTNIANGRSFNAFDSLAAAGSLTPASANYSSLSFRSISPSLTPTAVSPAVSRSRSPVSVSSTTTTLADDAFSSLFADATGSNSSVSSAAQRTTPATLADQLERQRSALSAKGSASDMLSLHTTNNPWDFDLLLPSNSSGIATPAFTISPAVQRTMQNTANANGSLSVADKRASVFDLLQSDDLSVPNSNRVVKGNRERASFGHHRERIDPAPKALVQDDGILGDLGKAFVTTESSPRISGNPTIMAPNPQKSGVSQTDRSPLRTIAARTPSPPPHVLGEIVTMGFSVQQAKLALTATLGASVPGQWDVQAALEVLLSDGAATAERETRSSHRSQKSPAQWQNNADVEDSMLAGRRSHRPVSNNTGGSSQPEILFTQASNVGASMLKSANAYWKTGKAQITKAVRENEFLQQQLQARSAGSSGRSTPDHRIGVNTPKSSRPKWMTDVDDTEPPNDVLAHRTSLDKSNTAAIAFRDDDGDSFEGSPPQRRPSPRLSGSVTRPKPRGQAPHEAVTAPSLNPVDLPPFEDRQGSGPAANRTSENVAVNGGDRNYSSPNRRSTRPIASSSNSRPTQSAPPALKPRPRRPRRQFVQCEAALISLSARARTLGNDCYKVGQYGQAIEHYTSALAYLPEGHLQRIPTLNNRSNARLKNGEERTACEDATSCLEVVLGGLMQGASHDKAQYMSAAQEISIHSESLASDQAVDPLDAIGKALSRRAKGSEAREKWPDALSDWQLLLEIGDARVTASAGGSSVVAAGISRCRRATEMTVSPSSTQRFNSKDPPKPKPKPAALRRVSLVRSIEPSQAVTAMREDNVQSEADEAERLRIKDSIDAKVQSWRGGKETNLRALLASLDTILWPELEWKKVGMHELVTENQLKIRYMRAIGKVHPDKLGLAATVAHRLIAGAVFGTLNDAWNASKRPDETLNRNGTAEVPGATQSQQIYTAEMPVQAEVLTEHPLSPTSSIIEDPLHGNSLQPDLLLAGTGDEMTLFGSDEAAVYKAVPSKSIREVIDNVSISSNVRELPECDVSTYSDRIVIHLSRAPHRLPISALRTEYAAISDQDTAAIVTQELSRQLEDLHRRFNEHQRQACAREAALVELLREGSGTQVSNATIQRALLRAQVASNAAGDGDASKAKANSRWFCEIPLQDRASLVGIDPLQTDLQDAMSDFSASYRSVSDDQIALSQITTVSPPGQRKSNQRASNSLMARMLGGNRNVTQNPSHTEDSPSMLGDTMTTATASSIKSNSHSRSPSVRSSNSVPSQPIPPKSMSSWATDLLGWRSATTVKLAITRDDESSESLRDASVPAAVSMSSSMSRGVLSMLGDSVAPESDSHRRNLRTSSTNLSESSPNTTAASSVSSPAQVSEGQQSTSKHVVCSGVSHDPTVTASTAVSIPHSASPVRYLGKKASFDHHADATATSRITDTSVSGAFVDISSRTTAADALSNLRVARAETVGHKTTEDVPLPSHFRAVSESASQYESDRAVINEKRLFAVPARVSLNVARWTERLLANRRYQAASPANPAPLDTQLAASIDLARSDSLSPISRAMSPRISQSAGKGLPVSASLSTQDASISSFSLCQAPQADVPEAEDATSRQRAPKPPSKGYVSSARGTISRVLGFGSSASATLRFDRLGDIRGPHGDVFTATMSPEANDGGMRQKGSQSITCALPPLDKQPSDPQRSTKPLAVELGTIMPSSVRPPTMSAVTTKRSEEDPLVDRFGFVYDLKGGMKLLREQRLRDRNDASPILMLDAPHADVDEADLKEALGPSPLATPHFQSTLKLPDVGHQQLQNDHTPNSDLMHNASIRKLLSNLVEMDDNVEKAQRDAWDAFIRQRQVKLYKLSTAKREKLAQSAGRKHAFQGSVSGPAGLAITAEDSDFLDGGLVGVATMGRGKEDDKLFRKLIRGGVPISYRPAIWVEISGANDLQEPGMYGDLLAKHADQDTPCLDQIDMDTHRTFPTNVFFAGSGPGVAKLRRVLIAYSWRDPVIGYCQGMNVLAALLLLVFPDEEEAFWMLASLLERVLPSDYYSPSLLVSQADQRVLRDLLHVYLPEVYAHLEEIGVDTPAVTFGWFLSLFADALPVQTLLRVWDALLVYGPVVLFRIAVALFKIYAVEILAAESASAFYVLISNLAAHTFNADKLLKVAFDDLRDIKRQPIERSRLKHVSELETELTPRLSPTK